MLFCAKIYYRSHPRTFGAPDLIVEDRLFLFGDGSFWHGLDWKKLKKQLESYNNPWLVCGDLVFGWIFCGIY